MRSTGIVGFLMLYHPQVKRLFMALIKQHGIFQEESSWADGPDAVTQCSIAPQNSFVYQFNVPDQAGTF